MSSRSAALLATLDRGMRIIELGPSHNPVARKDDGWKTTVVDRETREALAAKYANAPGVILSAMENVDVIWRSGPLHEAFPAAAQGSYDALLASHVLEHLPDLAGLFASAEWLLIPNAGVISLALPDKRFCYDCLRPASTTGQVLLAASTRATRHSRRTAFDEIAYAALLEGRLSWGREPSGGVSLFQPLEAAIEAFRTHREEADAPYLDFHAWQFTPCSFQLIVLELAEAGLCDWRIEWIESQPTTDFLVRLRRGRAAFASSGARDAERLRLLKGSLAEMREQIDWMLGAETTASASRVLSSANAPPGPRAAQIMLESGVTADWVAEDLTIGNDGERMVAYNSWGYWAHLSIYRFATSFAYGRRALDAGSGAGYGAAYLVSHGAAEVLALDAGADAVAHSRERYKDQRITYEVADLNLPLPVGDQTFDVVFSSNVFEHVANVDGLATECARVVTQNGVVIVAVPPIISAAVLDADIRNHFHVHHIPPSAWLAKLRRFFEDVQCYGHRGVGEFASKDRERAEIETSPDHVTIRETDFEFPETSTEDLEADPWSITAIFVCRRPRTVPDPETLAERSPAAWREGEAAARVIAEERVVSADLRAKMASLQTRIERAQAEVEDLRNSRSWRAMAPARALAMALRRRW